MPKEQIVGLDRELNWRDLALGLWLDHGRMNVARRRWRDGSAL